MSYVLQGRDEAPAGPGVWGPKMCSLTAECMQKQCLPRPQPEPSPAKQAAKHAALTTGFRWVTDQAVEEKQPESVKELKAFT